MQLNSRILQKNIVRKINETFLLGPNLTKYSLDYLKSGRLKSSLSDSDFQHAILSLTNIPSTPRMLGK